MTGKFDAMVTILNWLESGRTVTPQTIMDELSVSARTTYRYLTTLQEAGFPLFFNKERGSYAFAEGYALRKPHLNLRENLTFSLAKVSLKTMGGGMDKELASIERKLASPFRELPPHIIVAADEFSVDIREWFSVINRAIAERRRVAFVYTAASTREEHARIVDPYYLFFHDGYWTLRGWCHTRQEFRSFALDRIRELEMLEATYEPLPLDPETDYAGTFGRYADGEAVSVRLRFDAVCRPFLLRRSWHDSQKLTELPDGGFELEFQVKGILGIRPWLYRWLPDVTVEAPRELAELVVKELEEALARQREVNKGG